MESLEKKVLPFFVSVYTFSNPESFKTLTFSPSTKHWPSPQPHSTDIKICVHISISDFCDTNLKPKAITSTWWDPLVETKQALSLLPTESEN